MEMVAYLVSFLASVIGAICGIGGGVIIKPVLDAIGGYDVTTVTFLSSCTVLSMALFSLTRNVIKKEFNVEVRDISFVVLGSFLGGFLGKDFSNFIIDLTGSKNFMGFLQAVYLIAFTIITIIYTVRKSSIRTLMIRNKIVILTIGFILGYVSSFLGIGGGPFNLMVLSFFFSMETKEASINSICIILFSQVANLLLTCIQGKLPSCSINIVLGMVLCGLVGAAIGRHINKYIKDKVVNVLFILLMIIIIVINIYNAANFYGQI